ncbi:beta-lactamase family protein [Pyxidicoccus fallax]|uniref:Beta-lactamase family protein n=1 Tax=Pyxidicoccus fallax TaxID=394095 RepID=A0A848LHT0_9BACT|nr:serine hydrolase domain-containing protein [Pyxidicoccus fallax]NMO17171.1 beta-lactamase family protein [Pyxidicoccus fallax]NPC86595.1 beta-lactamase family protein [Pyxidicoccus fallax]
MRHAASSGVLVLLLTTLSAGPTLARAPLSPEQEAAILRTVQDELRESGAPGAAVAVVRNGETVFLRAFGQRSSEERIPVTPDTLFRLGSTTKMLTALAALDAASKGRLGLDVPVRTYVKDLHPALGKVTLRQLLSHTAGMREASPSVQSKDDSALADMVRGWKGDYLFAPPGDVFSYSGPGYWLAGLVLERVHGRPYADTMREQLFQPLGLERGTLRPLEALTFDVSQGHEDSGGVLKVVRPMAENTAMYPAGSAFSSARELARLTTILVRGGLDGERRVLPEAVVREFFTAHVPLPGAGPEEARYGFGLVRMRIGGTEVFEHGGVRRGYGSHIRFLPEQQGAIILLTNKNGVTLRDSLAHISRTVFGLPEQPEPPPDAPPLTAAEAERYTGTYTHADLARFAVSWDGTRLVLTTDAARPLQRVRQDGFRTEDGQELVFVFKPGQPKARYLHMDLLTAVRSRR